MRCKLSEMLSLNVQMRHCLNKYALILQKIPERQFKVVFKILVSLELQRDQKNTVNSQKKCLLPSFLGINKFTFTAREKDSLRNVLYM